jgi:hypothetical protein
MAFSSALDKDGNIRFFRQTLSRLKIDTVEGANVEINQERYQYITMQFVSVWAEHQARIGSNLLLDLNAPEYDTLIMVTDENRYTPFLWRKDAAVPASACDEHDSLTFDENMTAWKHDSRRNPCHQRQDGHQSKASLTDLPVVAVKGEPLRLRAPVTTPLTSAHR